MRILRIFDLLPMLHAGFVNKRAVLTGTPQNTTSGWCPPLIACGGISWVMSNLYEAYSTDCDIIFCSDRNPVVKKSLCPGYKSNRTHSISLEKQRTVAEEILQDCEFNVIANDGYEADDAIYSLVKANKDSYDHIYIYTGDSDLYFMVSDNVTVLPSSSRAKKVTKENYTYTAVYPGRVAYKEFMPYNMLTLVKICYGDPSDVIPGLPAELAKRILSAAVSSTRFQPLFGDYDFLRDFLSVFGTEALEHLDMVFPLVVDIPEDFSMGSKSRIKQWGNAMHNKYYDTGTPVDSHVKEVIEDMVSRGLQNDN